MSLLDLSFGGGGSSNTSLSLVYDQSSYYIRIKVDAYSFKLRLNRTTSFNEWTHVTVSLNRSNRVLTYGENGLTMSQVMISFSPKTTRCLNWRILSSFVKYLKTNRTIWKEAFISMATLWNFVQKLKLELYGAYVKLTIVTVDIIIITTIVFTIVNTTTTIIINIIIVDILNSASRILQCWSYYVKINSARHQHDSHRQLFRPLWGSSVWRNNQRKLWWKIPAHSDLSPDLELSTPTEPRHTTCVLGGIITCHHHHHHH